MANDNIVAVHPFRDAGRRRPLAPSSCTRTPPSVAGAHHLHHRAHAHREALRVPLRGRAHPRGLPPGAGTVRGAVHLRRGEAPISISSSPTKQGFIELCVRRTGRFHRAAAPDAVRRDRRGIRGPFGRGFPIDEMRGHDVLWWRAAWASRLCARSSTASTTSAASSGKVTIIYGSKNPSEVMFRNQFEMWKHRKDFELHLTVDHPDDTWDGEVGLVTKPFEHLEIDPTNTFGALCGPPIMYRFVVQEMRKKDIPYDRIYMSFERHMKCGVGKCGHCQVGHQYCCIDGPVFNYWEAKNIQGSM
ncbi:MAG: FAD/NAD(P)-binding protein [Adlercreutzia equolifaciens]